MKTPQKPEEIAALIHREFPPFPVPDYPPMMGVDPMGTDEYAGFANVPWLKIPPKLYGNNGYDISPPIGFSFSVATAYVELSFARFHNSVTVTRIGTRAY